jgi:outer membrane protein assembly factor BamD
MRINFLYVGILIITLTACNGYEKILKSTDIKLKYKKAFEYYNKEDYTRASALLEDISTAYQGSTKADSVYFFLAKSNYNLGFYEAAGVYYDMVYEKLPYSPFAQESEYMSAYCLYLVSPRPSLDQSNSTKAIEQFQAYLRKYPSGNYAAKSNELITELRDKLVDKSFYGAKLYYDLGMYKSSIVALRNSLEEFPNTKHREKLMWYVLSSRFLLAENSIEIKKKERYQETVDEYYSFISEFPKSEYKDDADNIYRNSEKMIK